MEGTDAENSPPPRSCSASASATWAGDVRVMWYSDGVEGAVIEDLLKRFMADNPGINVILDNVAYQVMQEQLPIQLQAGQGPDIARVTNLKEQAAHWLDLTPYLADPDYWRTNFADTLDWMRPDGSPGDPRLHDPAHAHRRLRQRDALRAGRTSPCLATAPPGTTGSTPRPRSPKALQLPAAFAIDRSGHRISGPYISYGANYVAPDGKPAPVDEGMRSFVGKLVELDRAGPMLKDTWVSAAGSTYRAGADDFINAQIPLYYSGSWQVANLSSKIGDAFDWVAIGSPCGTAACSGLQGGAGLVAVKYTKNPEEVAKVMEYLASEPVVKEFTERTLFLPAHRGIIDKGDLHFVSDDPHVQPALEKFVAASGEVAPAAALLPPWKWANAYYAALVTRTSQVMAGELPLDDAFTRMDQDIADAVAQAKQ